MGAPGVPCPDVTASTTPSIARLVDDRDSLSRLLGDLDRAPEADIALDTEADSFHHYFEKACLLQLSWGGAAYLVDPLAPLDVPALLQRLAPRRLLMHGADYDLRLLFRGYGFRATSLFDTMLAAQLLGEKEIGLAALLSARAGVALDKTHQRADWSARPLAPPMVAYAAADVLHLAALVESLTRDLEEKGRLAWHAEECARLAATTFSAGREADPENDWRIKGTNAFTDRERAFARALWEAREARARAFDLPPFRVLTNERLLRAVKPAAAGERDLRKLFPGPRALPDSFATAVREALARAAALGPAEWPKARRGERIEADPALEREVETLKKSRDQKAATLGLDPGILASRAVLTAAARARRANGRLTADLLVEQGGLSRWRAELLAS
ncbi:MAG TPA: ribonuclease D [Thermoanaerobaculia bacterium]|nr:ribonuclease D [Thermoanaerobaculia bacterium]